MRILENYRSRQQAIFIFASFFTFRLIKVERSPGGERMDAYMKISKEALRKNVSVIKEAAGKPIMAVVKANAYGLGLVGVAKTIQNSVSCFGVVHMSEAKMLLRARIQKPVHILTPGFHKELNEQLVPAIDNVNDLRKYEAHCQKEGYVGTFHLKINTGLNRFGIEPSELLSFLSELKTLRFVQITGVFSHFAGRSSWQKQLEIFKGCKEIIERHFKGLTYHIANTSATLDYPSSHMDMVRIGNGIYGFHTGENKDIALNRTFEIRAKVLNVRHVKAGVSIGYGEMVAERDMKVAVISFGAYEGMGLERNANAFKPDKLVVFIQGKGYPLLGKPMMNYICIGLDPEDEIFLGDEAIIHVGSVLALKETLPRLYI
jgi:alanine racemase